MLSRRVFRLRQAPLVAIARVARPTGLRFFNNEPSRDPLGQSRQAGYAARRPGMSSPYDAASPRRGEKAPRGDVSGNQEGVGFVDQVGSQSPTATMMEGKYGQVDISESSNEQADMTFSPFTDAAQQKADIKSKPSEATQNRRGEERVTGAGIPKSDSQKRAFHTSANARMATNAEQNLHLRHKLSSSGHDRDHGSACELRSLPPYHMSKWRASWSRERGLSTSARASQNDAKAKHTAESYFKDVDSSPPDSTHTYRVDESGTGATMRRPNEAMTGEFSRAGPESQEYETVSKKEPYDVPPSSGPAKEQKLRYGGEGRLDQSSSASKAGEGPEGADQGGRKP